MDNTAFEDTTYRVYSPGGNITALVRGLEPLACKRRLIQDLIMEKRPDVEQVGFVGVDTDNPELTMTGGEFCGNAARAAAWHYLGGEPGGLSLRVSGAAGVIKAGVAANLDAWAEAPVRGCRAEPEGDGAYWVAMEGISHLVLLPDASFAYLRDNPAASNQADRAAVRSFRENLVRAASRLLVSSGRAYDAAGVIFSENTGGCVKIHPCVFIKSAGTALFETACGSGSAALAVTAGCLRGRGVTLRVLQPSGSFITASVEYAGGRVAAGNISGPVVEL
jgi:diaminopimelate epimerase